MFGMNHRSFFIFSVVLMVLSMVGMAFGRSLIILYASIALVGLGNSNIFSLVFSQALISESEKKNEVSGLMMPGIDGLQLCKHLKSEVETSHIPIILLTARSLDDQKIEGFNLGADAYIPKPFNGKLLAARVDNLLKNRSMLKSVFSDNHDITGTPLGDIDNNFMGKWKIFRHFSNQSC